MILLPKRPRLRLSRRRARARLSFLRKFISPVVHARTRALAFMVTLVLSAKLAVKWSMDTEVPACTGYGTITHTSGMPWALCVLILRVV